MNNSWLGLNKRNKKGSWLSQLFHLIYLTWFICLYNKLTLVIICTFYIAAQQWKNLLQNPRLWHIRWQRSLQRNQDGNQVSSKKNLCEKHMLSKDEPLSTMSEPIGGVWFDATHGQWFPHNLVSRPSRRTPTHQRQ